VPPLGDASSSSSIARVRLASTSATSATEAPRTIRLRFRLAVTSSPSQPLQAAMPPPPIAGGGACGGMGRLERCFAGATATAPWLSSSVSPSATMCRPEKDLPLPQPPRDSDRMNLLAARGCGCGSSPSMPTLIMLRIGRPASSLSAKSMSFTSLSTVPIRCILPTSTMAPHLDSSPPPPTGGPASIVTSSLVLSALTPPPCTPGGPLGRDS